MNTNEALNTHVDYCTASDVLSEVKEALRDYFAAIFLDENDTSFRITFLNGQSFLLSVE